MEVNLQREPQIWEPQQLRAILDDDIKVMHLSEVETCEVEQDLLATRDVGFSTICRNREGLNEETIVVCLTTKRGVYVIDPRVPRHFMFLVDQFKNNNITFYSVDGRWDAYTILEQFGVRLEGRHYDLVVMDLYLTLHRTNVTGVLGRDNKLFLSYFSSELKRKPLKFEQLCAKYLDLTRVDLMINQEDKRTLQQYPYDVLALNTIKKKAGLMWVLTDAVVKALKNRMHNPSKTIFSFALKATGDRREHYDRSDDNSYANLCATLNSFSHDDFDQNGFNE